MDELTKDDKLPTRKSDRGFSNAASRETSFYPIDQADWLEPPQQLTDVPSKIAEFEIRALLGRGGFGSVYEAYDTVLQRQVAIKIPHRFSKPDSSDPAPDLREARAIASLDHPHIVPVYQASSAPGVPLYIVVRLIHGQTLGYWAAEVQPSFSQIAEVIAAVAEALGYAHARSVIHRDVKPSNVLVDKEGRAYIADFGLALREFDLDCGPAYVGTPAFMSPEQARGEGHRVDGRSDIFSLGVVLYELLTGVRPFRGSPTSALLNAIKSLEPEHPCHVNPRVPAELARVCLRALNKSLGGRYQRAEEMAIELREYCRASVSTNQPSQIRAVGTGTSSESGSLPTTELPGGQQVAPVVPKGLRAFEADDADFFLRLMPGPYDRHGLPNSVRFWKSRLESRSPNEAFSVGVLYGPSGCGKTSMFRAGVLPRLNSELQVVYVQATAHETEKVLQSALAGYLTPTIVGQDTVAQAAAPSESEEDIIRTFAKIRRQGGRKIIVCIDQFEQWLYGHSANLEQSILAQALRHCDGVHLQCVLMVRDDFWMGISRLMQALEIPISENQNASSVDLFDKQHARRVLSKFGAALGRLSANEAKWSQREQQFLTSAIDYLAVDGRVICVQLALLAEMMKHRDWNNAALFNQDGGAGIGVAFLEQTFESDSAPRRYRNHGEGAQRLLRQLLPEPGTRIKGAIQSESQLREAVGYTDENAFRELLRILDAELHLITPTARNELETYATQVSEPRVALDDEAGYQLTHDFLISPLRKWLDMRRLTTRLGQMQARLEEYSELYRTRPSSQSLPTLVEYLSMRWWLRNQDLDQPQRHMLRAAGQHYTMKVGGWAMGLAALLVLGFASQRYLESNYRGQVERKEADTLVVASLPEAIKQMGTFRPDQTRLWSALREYWQSPQSSREKKLRAAMALATNSSSAPDGDLREFLMSSYLQASALDSVVLCRTPLFSQTLLQDQLVKRYRDRGDSPAIQLRIAALLAQQIRHHPVLLEDPHRLVQLLIAENPLHLNDWIDVFRPLSAKLLPSIESTLLAQAEDGGLATVNLANLISNYAANTPELLATLASKVGPTAHALLLIAIGRNAESKAAVSEQLNKLMQSRQDVWDAEVAGSHWWIDPSAPPAPLDPSSLEALSKKWGDRGLLANRHFLTMLRVNVDELKLIEAEFKPLGFRVAAISPYMSDSQEQAMVLWKRDGRASEWVWPTSAAELRELNSQKLSDGKFTADLAEYSADNFHSTRFACVWTSTPPLPIVKETGIYLDVPVADHESEGWKQFTDRGFVPRIDIQSMDQSGREYFTSLRWRLAKWVPTSDHWNDQSGQLPDSLEQLNQDDVLVDAQRSNRAADADCGVTHVWWSDTPLDSAWACYAEKEKFLKRCEELQQLDFRPVSIHARCDDRPAQFSMVWWRPRQHVASHAEFARKYARLAIALHKTGNSKAVVDAFAGTDADVRAAVIDACARYQADPAWLLSHCLDEKLALSVRRAAVHALTLISTEAVAGEVINQAIAAWPKLLQTDDPGLRSALQALHRSWNLDLSRPRFEPVPGKEIQTVDGRRMVVLVPPPIMMVGSPAGEPGRNGHQERRYNVRMPRAFAIAVEEVTAAEYLKFAPDHTYADDYCPTPDSPMIEIQWYDAVRYCRWLSEQEKIAEDEMCYPPLAQIGPGMRLDTNYLNRTGYRLPTEAEWEYAARSGFKQGRHFGFLTELLAHYAWTAENSNYRGHPVAQLLPNEYGLFDMFGNAMEMCQNPLVKPEISGTPVSDPAESHLAIFDSDKMVSRGGATLFQPLDARAAHRDDHDADMKRPYLSFRIARTVRR